MAVLLCSGQGAQKPHMGESLLEVPEVAEVFARASKILNLDLPYLVRKAARKISIILLMRRLLPWRFP